MSHIYLDEEDLITKHDYLLKTLQIIKEAIKLQGNYKGEEHTHVLEVRQTTAGHMLYPEELNIIPIKNIGSYRKGYQLSQCVVCNQYILLDYDGENEILVSDAIGKELL